MAFAGEFDGGQPGGCTPTVVALAQRLAERSVVIVEDHRGRDRGKQPAEGRLRPRFAVELRVFLEIGDLLAWRLAHISSCANELDRLGGDLVRVHLRYQLLHVAGRLAFSGRRAKLHLQSTWPWASDLLTAFQKLKTLSPITA